MMPGSSCRATNVCGYPYSLQIRSQVSNVGERSPASISRYSRTLTPTSQAGRQTLRPSRFRPRCIIPGYAAKVGTTGSLELTHAGRNRTCQQRDESETGSELQKWTQGGFEPPTSWLPARTR